MALHNHIPAPRNTIETYSSRPEREPPRNEKGEIVCQHPSCQNKNETFRRPCEFNKHMDKHERPYKCNEPTCEQNPGFTYSGGLLRHMREVHKKGVGPARKSLYCPHANCIRSSGEGFTRRENLDEHLRRRHSYTANLSPPGSVASPTPSDSSEHPRKRRKTTESEATTEATEIREHEQVEDVRPVTTEQVELDRDQTIVQLQLARQEIARQATIIKSQEMELTELRKHLASFPSGHIYEAKPTLPPPMMNGSHAIKQDGDSDARKLQMLPQPPVNETLPKPEAPT